MRTLQLPKDYHRFSQFQSHYDAINEEESSSNKDSLLVSPHSKFSKASPVRKDDSIGSLEQSLMRFTKPFENNELNQTESKRKSQRHRDNRHVNCEKTTEPDFNCAETDRHESLENKIQYLLGLIKQKDKKIEELERRARERSPGSKENRLSPNKSDTISFSEAREDKKMESLRREVLFLTQNNLQLFEEVHRLSTICEQLKQKLLSTEKDHKTLQVQTKVWAKNLREEEKKNQVLLREKEQMIKNYQEEIKLFMRMKKVWEQNCEKEPITNRSGRSTMRTHTRSRCGGSK